MVINVQSLRFARHFAPLILTRGTLALGSICRSGGESVVSFSFFPGSPVVSCAAQLAEAEESASSDAPKANALRGTNPSLRIDALSRTGAVPATDLVRVELRSRMPEYIEGLGSLTVVGIEDGGERGAEGNEGSPWVPLSAVEGEALMYEDGASKEGNEALVHQNGSLAHESKPLVYGSEDRSDGVFVSVDIVFDPDVEILEMGDMGSSAKAQS